MHKYVHVIIGNESLDSHVHFPSGAHGYTYLNHVPETEVGDLVVVPCGPNRWPNIRFGKVVDAHSDDEKGKWAIKWIVDRLDVDKFLAVSALAPEDFVNGDNNG